MTTATAAAAASLRFDIVADKTQFVREVEQIRADFKAAAEEMQSAWSGIGGKIAEAAGRAWEGLESLAEQAQAAIAGGATGVEQGLLDGLEKVKAATSKFVESGLESLGEKWFGEIGARVGKGIGGFFEGIWDKVVGVGAEKLSGDGPIGTAFAGLLSRFEQLAPQAQQAFNAMGIEGVGDKMKGVVEGIRNAIAVIKGEQLSAKDFEAILAVLQAQTAEYEKQLEVIGKTAGEIARIRVLRALEAAGADLDSLGEEQLKRYEEALNKNVAAAQKIEDTRTGIRQADTYKQIVNHLERQVELENLKADRIGMTIGQVTELRAIEEAMLRMRRTGRELSEKELADVQARAKAAGFAADAGAKAVLEHQTMQGFERRAEIARIEMETLGMSIGPATAYRAEMQELLKFKEKMIPVSETMAEKIKAAAAAAGENATKLASMRDQLALVRDVGQTVARSLEGAFDKWIEGTKINVRDMVSSLIADLAKLTLRTQVLQPLFGGGAGGGTGLLGDIFAGMFRAEGGPVSAGQPYVVGEKRPELFIPNTSGTVLPYVPQMQASGPSYHIAPYIDARGATPDAVKMLEARIPALVVQTVQDARERGMMQ